MNEWNKMNEWKMEGASELWLYVSGILSSEPFVQTWVGRLSLECAVGACGTAEAPPKRSLS